MKYLATLLFPLFAALCAHAEELVQPIEFENDVLSIAAVPGQIDYPLADLSKPGIQRPVYAVKGWVRYENVAGDAYLQMDNQFGAIGTYFTKTLAPAGPLAKLTGSSDWRPFTLPFYANTGDQASDSVPLPERLSLSLHLPGSGTVSIRDAALYQYPPGTDPMQVTGQWFGNSAAGLLGGIGGALIGVWGAVIGGLASRGKARGFALGSANALLVLGVLCALAGAAALVGGQPYAVYFPLLLLGVIVLAVMGSTRKSLAARYEQVELQKMRAMDV